MANDGFKVKNKINLVPKAAPGLDTEGDLAVNSSDSRLQVYVEGALRDILTDDQTQTLTNKTIDGSLNTITNVGAGALSDGSVTTAKLSDLAVTAGKLADNSVTTVKVLDSAVTTSKISDASITSAKMALDASLELPEIATPATPVSGRVRLYAKTDNKLYILDDLGVETEVGAGAGGDVIGPGSSTSDAIVRFADASGTLLADSPAILTSAGVLSGLTELNVDNLRLDGATISIPTFASGVSLSITTPDKTAATGSDISVITGGNGSGGTGRGGDLLLATGALTTANGISSGQISIATGTSNQNFKGSGALSLVSGNTTGNGSASGSGAISIATGNTTGASNQSGSLSLSTGTTSQTGGATGLVSIASGAPSGSGSSSGAVSLASGASDGDSGTAGVASGASVDGSSGAASLSSGASTNLNSGNTTVGTGAASNGSSGDSIITTGNANSSGDVVLSTGTGVASKGRIDASGGSRLLIPTATADTGLGGPAANGDLYYNTASNQFRYASGSTISALNSSVVDKNYIPNPDMEGGTIADFSLGTVTLTANLPTGTPTFGSGASGNLSLALISSGQLAGAHSLSYASSAATTAGNFVATEAFTIDKEDQAKTLSFQFYYEAASGSGNGNFSGTTSSSFGVAIRDITNSTWIIPTGVFSLTQSSGVGIASGTFSSSATGTSYRLVIYNANASAGAITLYIDDVYLGPKTIVEPLEVVGLFATSTSTASIATTTNTILTGYTATHDTHSILSGTDTITIPITGWYQFTAGASFVSSSATYQAEINLFKNGVRLLGMAPALRSSITPTSLNFAGSSPAVYLNAGDVMTFRVYQTGGSKALSGDTAWQYISCMKLGN